MKTNEVTAGTDNTTWWNGLSADWKQAYNEVFSQRKDEDMPADEILETIRNSTVLRIAGPDAMFPNTGISLKDLSGVKGLKNLEILVVINHHIHSLEAISSMTTLHSLFVFSNHIQSLHGLEKLTGLKKLYFNDNKVSSLKPLSDLLQLETIHCAHNKISSLKGIGKKHKSLKEFFCLPNDDLWTSEIMRFETETKIRCLKG